MSQGPSFLFIDLHHVVADDFDLYKNEVTFGRATKLLRTHSFLNPVCLEGNEPGEGLR